MTVRETDAPVAAPRGEPLDAAGGMDAAARAERLRVERAYERREGAGRYSWLAPAYVHLAQGVERGLLATLKRVPAVAGAGSLAGVRVLEVGCGTGHWLRSLVQWGVEPSNVFGVDLQAARLAEARRRCAPGVRLACASGAALPFADGSFDAVLQVTTFSSILDDSIRRRVADEMRRVLAPRGCIVWYDFHVGNPRNRDVRPVGRGEIARLFPGCRVELRRTTLAPPLLRLLAPVSRTAASLLELLPPLRTHHVGLVTPLPGE